MITEDYVSFKIAKLLKEKWFKFIENRDELANAYIHAYTKEGKEVWGCYDSDYYPCITIHMAMKWLREVHNVHIIAEPCLGEGNEPNLSFNRWFWTILKEEGEYKPIRQIDEFPTYEQACEAAIKYCLENLI